MPSICIAEVEVIYLGKASHASAMPHKVLTLWTVCCWPIKPFPICASTFAPPSAFTALLKRAVLPNIVPDRTVGQFYVRAANEKDLAKLDPGFRPALRPVLPAVAVLWRSIGPGRLLDLNTNWPLADRFRHHAEQLGAAFVEHEQALKFGAGSTDMGNNIGYRLPSIHPMLAVAPPVWSFTTPSLPTGHDPNRRRSGH